MRRPASAVRQMLMGRRNHAAAFLFWPGLFGKLTRKLKKPAHILQSVRLLIHRSSNLRGRM